MSKHISDIEIQRIRTGNYINVHMETLTKISKSRFRGLGQVWSEKFLVESLRRFDDIGLHDHRDAAYLIFIMNYLGTYFLDDPRYTTLRSIYYTTANKAHVTDEAHREFVRISRTYIGKNNEIFSQALGRFVSMVGEKSALSITPETCLDMYIEFFGLPSDQRHTFPRWEMLMLASQAASELNMNSPRGVSVALGLSLWLGSGFHHDPLFPWVRDITADAKSAEQRASLLHEYGIKRAHTQLSQDGR